MTRTREQLDYHAAKEREYRRLQAEERFQAISELGRAVETLTAQGWKPSRIVGLVVDELALSAAGPLNEPEQGQ